MLGVHDLGTYSRPIEARTHPFLLCCDDALRRHPAAERVSGRLLEQGNDNRCPTLPRERRRKKERHLGANYPGTSAHRSVSMSISIPALTLVITCSS